jgi:hypothetical protein
MLGMGSIVTSKERGSVGLHYTTHGFGVGRFNSPFSKRDFPYALYSLHFLPRIPRMGIKWGGIIWRFVWSHKPSGSPVVLEISIVPESVFVGYPQFLLMNL